MNNAEKGPQGRRPEHARRPIVERLTGGILFLREKIMKGKPETRRSAEFLPTDTPIPSPEEKTPEE